MPSNVKVAVTQLEPGWFDLQKSVDKTVKSIKEAADNGAKLISFPECWIPGAPPATLPSPLLHRVLC
jgi:nitrilase